MIKNPLKKKLQLKILTVFIIMSSIVLLIFYPTMPRILNYPENTYNNQFQWELEHANYTIQFVEISLAIILLYSFLLIKKLSFLDNLEDALKNNDAKKLNYVRNKLFSTPKELYLLQTLLPSIAIPILYVITTHLFNMTTLKVFILYASFVTVMSTLSYVYIKKQFAKLLEKINVPLNNFNNPSSLTSRLNLQVNPLIIVALLFTSLVGYSLIIDHTAQITYELYTSKLNASFDKPISSEEEIYTILSQIELSNSNDIAFVQNPDGTFYGINKNEINFSDFWIKYLNEFSKKDNSIVYDYYGVDVRGAIIPIILNGQTYIVGFQFNLTSIHALIIFGIEILCLFIINIIALRITSKSVADEVQSVTDGMNSIITREQIDYLAVTSDDEIGKLIVAFNEIQTLTNENIKQIEDNQQTLMEKERLASLGQLIGGIAHNMKTPIMSISGATEGLTELIGEYIASIDNPIVTSDDHKEIAKDMLEWVTKIKTHTSYMSDILSAVKGQASQLNVSENTSFTIYDLAKKVEILIKHEIKKALLVLDIDIKCDPAQIIHGDINNLIQVVNNLISNSIQSYNGKPNEHIVLRFDIINNKIIINVIDKGSGMSEEVKNKLFKEMVTTKGKNGTGLGLYMSYSTIKGKFNGDITFESEQNQGTTFTITLPIS